MTHQDITTLLIHKDRLISKTAVRYAAVSLSLCAISFLFHFPTLETFTTSTMASAITPIVFYFAFKYRNIYIGSLIGIPFFFVLNTLSSGILPNFQAVLMTIGFSALFIYLSHKLLLNFSLKKQLKNHYSQIEEDEEFNAYMVGKGLFSNRYVNHLRYLQAWLGYINQLKAQIERQSELTKNPELIKLIETIVKEAKEHLGKQGYKKPLKPISDQELLNRLTHSNLTPYIECFEQCFEIKNKVNEKAK